MSPLSPRTRSLAALGLTLALGLVLGVLLGGGLAARRFERLGALAFPPHLLALMHEELELSPLQSAAVDSILEGQSQQISLRIRDHRALMKRQMDSLLLAIKPHLSEAQWLRLKERIADFRPRRGFRRGGPPFDPEGQGGPGGPGGWRHRGGRGGRGPGGPPPEGCPRDSAGGPPAEPAGRP